MRWPVNVALLSPWNDHLHPVTRDRLAGIRQSFEEHGIDESKIHVIDGICSSIQAEKALNDVIVKQEFPKTIIFSNQNCLEGLVRAIWKNNVKINKDIFISGFATDSLSNLYNIKGICAIQDDYKIGLELGNFCMKKLKSSSKNTSPKNDWFQNFGGMRIIPLASVMVGK